MKVPSVFEKLYGRVWGTTPSGTAAAPAQGSATDTTAKADKGTLATPAAAMLASTKLNQAEKAAYKKKRGAAPWWFYALKYSAITLTLVVGLGSAWLAVDLDPDNRVIAQLAGVQNLRVQSQSVLATHSELATLADKYQQQKNELTGNIDAEKYTEYQHIIDEAISNQWTWFDGVDTQGQAVIGLLDAPDRMMHYFNSVEYEHQILANNTIDLSGLSVDRSGMSLSVQATNLYGKVFFLASEFTEMMNSYDFLRDGSLSNFSRSSAPSGEDTMGFNLQLAIQRDSTLGGLPDTHDAKFALYSDWHVRTQGTLPTGRPVGTSAPTAGTRSLGGALQQVGANLQRGGQLLEQAVTDTLTDTFKASALKPDSTTDKPTPGPRPSPRPPSADTPSP